MLQKIRRGDAKCRGEKKREGRSQEFQGNISFKKLKPMKNFVHLNLLRGNLENMWII